MTAKRKLMSHAKWLQLMRDGRPVNELARAYKRCAISIHAIKRGDSYRRWYAALIATGERPVTPGSVAPEPPREPHWSITQPWRLEA